MSLNKNECTLTFEWDSDKEVLEIHCNKDGLAKFRNIIDSLNARIGNDHVHLMTESWGGSELSEDKQCSDNELVNHVKIFKWDDNN